MAQEHSTSTTIPSSFSIPIGEKLTKSNYLLWKAQIMPAIRAAQLEPFLTGAAKRPAATISTKDKEDVPNPAYAEWVARDQAVLGYLLTSLTRDVLSSVAACSTAAEVWSSLAQMYSSLTSARKVNTRIALATTKKGAMTIAEYYTKMRGYADEMAASGKPLDDEEFVSFLLKGLEEDFNPVVTAVIARYDPISPGELYTQLLSYECRMNLQVAPSPPAYSSANSAGRGCGATWGRNGFSGPGYSRGRGRRSRGAGRSGSAPPGRGFLGAAPSDAGSSSRPKCQVCFRLGHTAATCRHRFDETFTPE